MLRKHLYVQENRTRYSSEDINTVAEALYGLTNQQPDVWFPSRASGIRPLKVAPWSGDSREVRGNFPLSPPWHLGNPYGRSKALKLVSPKRGLQLINPTEALALSDSSILPPSVIPELLLSLTVLLGIKVYRPSDSLLPGRWASRAETLESLVRELGHTRIRVMPRIEDATHTERRKPEEVAAQRLQIYTSGVDQVALGESMAAALEDMKRYRAAWLRLEKQRQKIEKSGGKVPHLYIDPHRAFQILLEQLEKT